MNEELLREYIRRLCENIMLSPRALAKYGPRRFNTFLDMLNDNKPFLIKGGKRVTIEASEKLVEALKAMDAHAVNDVLKEAAYTDVTNKSAGVGLRLSLIEKTREFGGYAGRDKPMDYDQNEHAVVYAVNLETSRLKAPISVTIGDMTFKDVARAISVGNRRYGREISKADVILETTKGARHKLSVKMTRGAYYLSGDKVMAPIVGPMIEDLVASQAPAPRIEKQGDTYVMLTGQEHDSKRVEFKFGIDPSLARLAVFGRGINSVDVIARGDFTQLPVQQEDDLSWPDVKTYTTLESLPEQFKPVGLLRFETARGVSWNGIHYVGIRPVVIIAFRTKNAIDISRV